MNNVKLAFERYLDVKTIQRRQSLLKWSLESSNTSQFTPLYTRGDWTGISSLQTIEKSSIFQLNSLRDLESVKAEVNQFRRNLSSTDTRFFDNNFDIIVNESSSPPTLEWGASQFQLLKKDLQMFSGERDDYTPDVILRVNTLFHWLYENKLYSLAYDLVMQVLNSIDVFFRYNELTFVITVIDHDGTIDDLMKFSEVYKTRPTPSILKRTRRLGGSQTMIELTQLKHTLSMADFNNSIKIIESLIASEESNLNGLKYTIYQLIEQALPKFTHSEEMKDFILNTNDRGFLPPSLITFIYSKKEFGSIEEEVDFFSEFIKLHQLQKEENFEFRVYQNLKKMKKSTLALRVWYENNYKREVILGHGLVIDGTYPQLEKLHKEKMDNLPRGFQKEMKLNEDDHSSVLSLLIFTHSQYGKDFQKVKNYYLFKKENGMEIKTIDQLCYISALINSKDYDAVLANYEQVMESAMESAKLMDDLMVGFARSQKWSEMEQLYMKRFLNNEEVTMHQYTALFISLSMRSGSIKFILKLWETFLKAGYSPNDHILCCIIISFIKSKAYREGLQWFSAYSKYNIPLSARSYGLMINILASTRDSATVFQLLDTLIEQGRGKLRGKFMGSVLRQFASIGDYKSIERLILEYYPKFRIRITSEHTRWVLKSHYFSNRFSVVLKQFWRTSDEELDYDLALLALATGIKLKTPAEFRAIWERIYPIFSKNGQLDFKGYGYFMGYWVRAYGGLFGSRGKLDEIKRTMGVDRLPMVVYNEMMFSAIRTKKPWLVERIVEMAREDRAVLTSRSYSLMLYSYVSMPWMAAKRSGECVKLFDDVLAGKRGDEFGMIDLDVNPIVMKKVVKTVIDGGDVYEARRVFEKYLEKATDNLLDNIHVLNVELQLLGEEERWVEFDGCYKKYIEIIEKSMVEARMTGSGGSSMGKVDVPRAERSAMAEMDVQYDEAKIRRNDPMGKIPNWLKHAHFDVWKYRLRQLEVTESLASVNDIFNDLVKRGVVMSNKNLNETALVLSGKNWLFDETVEFINRNLLPGHLHAKSYDRMELRHGWGNTGGLIGVGRPLYHFIPDVYFKVLSNLNETLDGVMDLAQKELFLERVGGAFEFSILKNLPGVVAGGHWGRVWHGAFTSRRGGFYRRRRRVNRLYWRGRERASSEERDEMHRLAGEAVRLERSGLRGRDTAIAQRELVKKRVISAEQVKRS